MKHKITFPVHGVEGEMKVYDAKGQLMEGVIVGSVEWEPFFFNKAGLPVVNNQQVIAKDGTVVGKYAETLSGKSARLGLMDRTKRVTPQFEEEVDTEEPEIQEEATVEEAADELPDAATALPFDTVAKPTRVQRRPAPGE